MTALATQADVEAELGRTLTAGEAARMEASLNAASAYVRAKTRRKWEAGTHTVVRRPSGGRVVLDAPASVTAVSTIDSTGTAAAVDASTYTLRGSTVYGLAYACEYEITYTATGDVPADLVQVVAAMAARDLTEDRPQGATSYSITKGPFSESAQFEEPTDSAEPTRAEAAIIARHTARRTRTLSIL